MTKPTLRTRFILFKFKIEKRIFNKRCVVCGHLVSPHEFIMYRHQACNLEDYYYHLGCANLQHNPDAINLLKERMNKEFKSSQ